MGMDAALISTQRIWQLVDVVFIKESEPCYLTMTVFRRRLKLQLCALHITVSVDPQKEECQR